MLFGGAYVCTNVCRSDDEILLFGKHFGLSMYNDVHPYLAPFVLDAWMGWRHIRTQVKWYSDQSVVCGQPDVSTLSMGTAPYTLC